MAGQVPQFLLQISEKLRDVQPVRQCMVHIQRHRQGGAPACGDGLAPADAGVGVVGTDGGMLQLGIVQPRQSGYKEKAQGVDPLSFFFVSALPWLHYSQLEHPAVSADDSNPRISWGKAITAGGRTTLPVSLYVNHALADGLHISQFFANLEKELRDLTRQWNPESEN